MMHPSPEVVYQCNLEYLGELCKLIADKYNQEYVWGDTEESDSDQTIQTSENEFGGVSMFTPTYQHMNCSVVFNKTKDAVLFCKRMNDPYKGCLNFVGGKVEQGESSIDAAYRELQEETGITPKQIQLYHFMDITYYHQEFVLEMYTGILEDDVKLREEKNPLIWLHLTEDFTDRDRFAGEQNIAHIINVALKYPIPSKICCQMADT